MILMCVYKLSMKAELVVLCKEVELPRQSIKQIGLKEFLRRQIDTVGKDQKN